MEPGDASTAKALANLEALNLAILKLQIAVFALAKATAHGVTARASDKYIGGIAQVMPPNIL